MLFRLPDQGQAFFRSLSRPLRDSPPAPYSCFRRYFSTCRVLSESKPKSGVILQSDQPVAAGYAACICHFVRV